MIYHKLNIIKKTGVTAAMQDDDRRKVMVVNSFSFLTALLCTFCGISLSVISGHWIILYTSLAFVAGFLSILLLNKKHHYSLAKFGLLFVYCTVMLYYGTTFGESTQVHFLGLFLIGVPLLICSPREKGLKCACLALPITGLIIMEANYYYQVFEPMELTRSMTFAFRWLIMTVVVVLNGMVIIFHQDSIVSLLKTLGIRNKALRRTNEEIAGKEAELKLAYKELESYNEKLEREVAQRTAQLSANYTVQGRILEDLRNTMAQMQRKDVQLEQYVAELEVLKGHLTTARDDAENANAAKSAFLREISHEIRNPLNAIIGISYLLLNDNSNKSKVPQSIVNYIENIYTSSHSLLEIINNVLELAKIEAGKTDDIRQESFALRDWVRSVVTIYQNAAKIKDVGLQLQIDHTLPAHILGDRVHLTQILNNLLANAIKFTPANKKVTLYCFRQGSEEWCIRVADEGVGIAKEKQGLIFQPFEQADKTIYHKFGGTGLGLAISKRIAELMDGKIEVWSQPGEGTAFTVTLPLKIEKNQQLQETVPGKKQFSALSSDKRILLMEDNQTNQMIMERFFANIGIKILIADNGLEGVEMVRAHLPDLIIMDMHMPKLSGREALQIIREDPALRHIPVIAISADAFREQQESAITAGVNEYLIKPVEFDRLYEVVDKYLDANYLVEEERFVAKVS